MATKLRVRHVRGGESCDRLVGCALGHQIDRAGHGAAGRHAVEQRRWALQYLDAFKHLGRSAVVRRDAEQAIHRHVGGARCKAANRVVLAPCAGDAVAEHRGVGGGDHVGDALRLAIFDELFRIGDGAERGIHEILVAKEPHAAARGHLAAGIGGACSTFLPLHGHLRQGRGFSGRGCFGGLGECREGRGEAQHQRHPNAGFEREGRVEGGWCVALAGIWAHDRF